jgi:hypothetical protein
MPRAKKETQPLWRPNFVNAGELPDIKVVRTGFIINLIAVILALLAVGTLVQREYRAHTLANSVSILEEQIRVADSGDEQSLKLSEAFRRSAQYVIELEKFYERPLRYHDLLFGLSQIRPKDLIFNSVSLNESITKQGGKDALAYTINITGDVRSLTVLDDFKKILAESALLQVPGFSLEIGESLQGRDEKTGIFPYRLNISLKPVAAKASSKKGDAS